MNNTAYKEYHESFMLNNNGSTAVHTCLCIYFTLQCALLCAIKQIRNNTKRYMSEYLIIILPMILAHTVLSDYIYELNIAVFILLIYEIAKNYNNLDVHKTLTSGNVYLNNKIHLITCLRGLTYLITGLCILAVDFRDFPRHLAKTEKYGYSLMDTGVGLFVLISGLVHKDVNKNNYHTVLKSNTKFVLILLLLGIARYLSVKKLDYQVHVSEYGVHWNFFFTLAICKFFSTILLILSSRVLVLCIVVIISHELFLYNGLQDWVFSDTERISFIDANREGISSSPGYVALYLFAAYLKKELMKTSHNRYCILRNLLSSSVILLIISIAINRIRPISRTLANAGYCFYISTVLAFGVTIIYFIEVIFQGNKKTRFEVPLILAAINNNGLLYFLMANLSTGIINLSLQTFLVSSLTTFVILNCYMIFTIYLTIYLNKKGIKL
ncbi:GPI-anchored wall transfer protein 1-like [Vanessa atalanta]|uniref:GPI-anchored wall transfer protein 1-like n=1 Tax=Vanessa atalanta TaxID=42275 RepID=UPI001FCD2414|nr:GPI-anchored wall transfer protein 1-like [Vanessa atalanta]